MNILEAIASQVPEEVLATGYFEYVIVTDDDKRIPMPEAQVWQAVDAFGEDSKVFRRFVTNHYQIEKPS